MKIRKILSLFLMLCLLAGCGAQPTTQETTHADDAVVIALDVNSEPAAGFDPAYGWGAGEHVHEPLIQSTLTVTNPDLTIGYDLATGYTVSEDGLTWTVTIRDDVKFTDGEPLTASDVAFTMVIKFFKSKHNSRHGDITHQDNRYCRRQQHQPLDPVMF